jgi:hypothetical protein
MMADHLVTEEAVEKLEFAAEEYRMALGLIGDLLRDAERIYEPGYEDPPHIAAARNLTEHEEALKDIGEIAAQLPAIAAAAVEAERERARNVASAERYDEAIKAGLPEAWLIANRGSGGGMNDHTLCLGIRSIVDAVLSQMGPDYSPAYQDEYQRLWHEAAADAQKAEQAVEEKDAEIDRLRERDCAAEALKLLRAGVWRGR